MDLEGFLIIGLYKEDVGQGTGRDCQVLAWFSNLLRTSEFSFAVGPVSSAVEKQEIVHC